MGQILLVEDDPTIGRLVVAGLRRDGHVVTWVSSGTEAGLVARGRTLDLVLLDLGLPDLDGLQVCRALRTTQPDAVIVILTARRDEIDVIVGLESGADDYVTKPFGIGALQARVRAHLRRNRQPADKPSAYSCDDVTIDLSVRRCLLAGREVRLRSKEFDLLARLVSGAGKALSRETLMADVWGVDWVGSTKTLDVHVAAVRRRLLQAAADQPTPPTVPEIKTLRGYGYRLEPARLEPPAVAIARR